MPEATKRTCRLVTRKDEASALFTSALMGWLQAAGCEGFGDIAVVAWGLGGCISVKRQSFCWSVIHMQVAESIFFGDAMAPRHVGYRASFSNF